MAEMDIYMRRRLVALGGLVLFFILFVLLVKSCGGDDEPEPVAEAPPTGATGATGGALAEEDFILQADEICGPANNAVGSLDPGDPGAAQDEFVITRDALSALESLELAEPSPNIERFISDLSVVVGALRAKAKAGDPVAADAAQLEIDTAEVDARDSGERAGFSECGQFLDAGQGPSGGGGGGGGGGTPIEPTAPVDPSVPAPTEPVVPAPTEPTTPAPTTPTAPPDDSGGGITP